MLDVERVRAQFPALAMTLDDGRPCIFLDNPAGTQVPRRVVDAMATYLLTSNANTGGAFLTSRRSDAAVGEARRAMADFVGVSDPDCIIFGANMTTLTFAIARYRPRPGARRRDTLHRARPRRQHRPLAGPGRGARRPRAAHQHAP